MITGQGAYSKMKYESGVHRVQRVPETEIRRTYPHLHDQCGGDAGGGETLILSLMRRISVSMLCVHPETVDSVSTPPTLRYV